MGALGKLFSTIFSRWFSFLGTYISGKFLLLAAATATFITLLGLLNTLFNTLLQGLVMTMPAEYAWGLGILPKNVPACVSAIITARLSIWVFQVKWAVVKIKMQG